MKIRDHLKDMVVAVLNTANLGLDQLAGFCNAVEAHTDSLVNQLTAHGLGRFTWPIEDALIVFLDGTTFLGDGICAAVDGTATLLGIEAAPGEEAPQERETAPEPMEPHPLADADGVVRIQDPGRFRAKVLALLEEEGGDWNAAQVVGERIKKYAEKYGIGPALLGMSPEDAERYGSSATMRGVPGMEGTE